MGPLAVGDVVLLAFPYSDFSSLKIRPALIVGETEFNNFITCQITSKANTSKKAILLSDNDFENGGLEVDSYIRPDKLFTIEQSVIQNKAGVLMYEKIKHVRTSIRKIFG
jgi:mRNA interferase MazF